MVNNVLNLIYNTQEANTKHPNPLALDTGDFNKSTGKSYGKGSGSYGAFKKSQSAMSGVTNAREEPESKNTQDNFEATKMLAKKIV